MDTDEYLKADKRNYHKLAPVIDALGFTEVNLITKSKMIFSPNKFVDKLFLMWSLRFKLVSITK